MARIDLINISATPQGAGPASAARVPRHAAAAARPSFRIDDLSLSIFDGETLVILGPSGCGKTTLLKIIAGLLKTGSGEVRYDGVKVDDVPPGDRRVGMDRHDGGVMTRSTSSLRPAVVDVPEF